MSLRKLLDYIFLHGYDWVECQEVPYYKYPLKLTEDDILDAKDELDRRNFSKLPRGLYLSKLTKVLQKANYMMT